MIKQELNIAPRAVFVFTPGETRDEKELTVTLERFGKPDNTNKSEMRIN